MPQDNPRYDLDRVVRFAMSAGILAAIIWLLAYLSDVLVPFALAVIIAYLLNPIVNAFENKTGRRSAAVFLTLTIVTVFVLTAVPLLAAVVYLEIADVSRVVGERELKQKIVDTVEPWISRLQSPEFSDMLAEFEQHTTPEQIQQAALQAAKFLLPKLANLTSGVVGFLGGVLEAILALTVVIIILLYVVFLLMDFNSFQQRWRDQLPPKYRAHLAALFEDFSQAMKRYFRGQFVVAVCCGILLAIGFKIIGLRLAILLGLFTGMLNMVPYLQIAGLVPAILLALLRSFETDVGPLWPLVGVAVVFGVVQLIQDGVLVPKIMGRSTGLKPWVILLSLFIWGKLLGMLGLVLAIPLSCLGLAYYQRFILHDTGTPRPQ